MGFKVKQSSGSGETLTASQILTLIKTVDGVDSGLDSDFLRGKTPSQIVTENLIESDPTVSSFTKGLSSNDAVLTALNASSGLISSDRLPSYVDDILSYAAIVNFPVAGETSKIYVAEDTNKIYRWSGSSYVEISSAATADTALKLSTPRTISTTGDATYSVSFDGSTNVSSAITLANSGVTAGTYNNSATQVRPFTVDAKGRIAGVGTPVDIAPPWSAVTGKPTTLNGYGITDGQPLGNELTAIQALSDTPGFLKKTGDGSYSIDNNNYLPLSGGTVTGVTIFSNATSSTSTTTGAVVVSGGVGVGGAVFVSNLYTTGNTGIGTATPDTRLHISHTSTENLSANPSWPSGTLKLEDNSAFDSGMGPSVIFYKKRDANGNQSVAAGITAIGVANSEKLQFYVGSAANLGLPKMTIQVDGNVGIGTIPSAKLDVNGSAKATSFFVETNQVVSARRTGWVAPTGTATRTTFATSTVTLPQLAERVKALIDDLTTHGLIGA